jgi:hypothetical protein
MDTIFPSFFQFSLLSFQNAVRLLPRSVVSKRAREDSKNTCQKGAKCLSPSGEISVRM